MLALAPEPECEIPDLASYDVIEISSSGGKDSLAMNGYVSRLLRVAGLMERGVVVHSDLGRAEWPGTPELVERQAALFGLRFIKVKRPQGDPSLEHVVKLGKWMMPTQRFCTADHKRGQIIRAFTALADEGARHVGASRARTARCGSWNCVGLRAEGRARVVQKRPQLLRDPRASSSRRHVDVLAAAPALDRGAGLGGVQGVKGAPIHPAYAAGMPRASCVFCIYASEGALQIAGALHPDLLAEYVAVEKQIGHTFKRHLPLAKVAADVAAGVRPSGPIENWCM